MKQAFEIIKKPLISEQSLRDAEKGKYSFIVLKSASKDDIKRAVSEMFGVNVSKIMTNIIKGNRTKLTKKRKVVADASYKKARIMLKKGEKLDIFDEHIEGK